MNVIVSKARQESNPSLTPIPIELNPCEPSKIIPEEIARQLNAIGLCCEETHGDKLRKHIEDVTSKITSGSLQSFGIYMDSGPLDTKQLAGLNISPADTAPDDELLNRIITSRFSQKAAGHWFPDSPGGYTNILATIQMQENYNYLKRSCPDFPYAEYPSKTVTSNTRIVDAIKSIFAETLTACTAATVQGIDQGSMMAIFSNCMSMLNPSVLNDDFHCNDNRIIFLVHNYDARTYTADGIGFVSCEWTIDIKNYKDKDSERHESKITTSARSALYTDERLLMKHYNMLTSKKDIVAIMANT